MVREVDLENRTLSVLFDDRVIEYDVTELDELTLAYATTIHKSQGSEYPIVVMPVLMTHYVMLQRNMVTVQVQHLDFSIDLTLHIVPIQWLF